MVLMVLKVVLDKNVSVDACRLIERQNLYICMPSSVSTITLMSLAFSASDIYMTFFYVCLREKGRKRL